MVFIWEVHFTKGQFTSPRRGKTVFHLRRGAPDKLTSSSQSPQRWPLRRRTCPSSKTLRSWCRPSWQNLLILVALISFLVLIAKGTMKITRRREISLRTAVVIRILRNEDPSHLSFKKLYTSDFSHFLQPFVQILNAEVLIQLYTQAGMTGTRQSSLAVWTRRKTESKQWHGIVVKL